MKNGKDHFGLSLSNVGNSHNNKQLQGQSTPKLESVNETLQSMNIVNLKKSIQYSASPKQNKSQDYLDQQQSSKSNSIGPSNGSTVYDEVSSRYQCIAQLTQQQNLNLKQQNTYLVQKLRKMQQREIKIKKLYEKAKKYKILYQQAQMQIEVLKDQCQVYKDQAQQMKKIVLNDVYRLRQKIMQTHMENGIHDILQSSPDIYQLITSRQQSDLHNSYQQQNKI